MKALLEELESWRESADLTQAQVARKLGTKRQTYNSWVRTRNIPKKYIDPVRQLLAKENPEFAEFEEVLAGLEMSALEQALLEHLKEMPRKKLLHFIKIALQYLDD